MPELQALRVLHVITSLDVGGAETMLVKLLQELAADVPSAVVVLKDRGPLALPIEKLAVPIHFLGVRRNRLPGPKAVLRLVSAARKFRPNVVQGWMYHGNLAAWLASRILGGNPRFVMNVRQTLYDFSRERSLTRYVIKAGAMLSAAADAVIYNSVLSASQHEAVGYRREKRVLIPNGFDLDVLKPDPDVRAQVREEFKLDPAARLIGHVSRFHPMKDHATLLEAARLLVDRIGDAKFLLVGHGVTNENAELSAMVHRLGLVQNVIFAGERSDVPRIMAAIDLAVLPSAWGEGFPNVVGEAMATGVPCVVTDVGDSAMLVGDCGRVVPVRDPMALAHAMVEVLNSADSERADLGRRARERIRDNFALDRIAEMYRNTYLGSGCA
jgi:glycosyltransferase involved in cell wall biosynthesis